MTGGKLSRVTDSPSQDRDPSDPITESGKESTALSTAPGESETDIDDITGQVEQPAKVMRIGTMVKQLLEEVRQAPLDEAGRKRLREIYESSIKELSSGLSTDLQDELDRLSLPFGGDVPSEAELRVAQAQLVGWLEGLFHGIQTAIFAQQAAARAQLEQMAGRRQLPGGGGGQQVVVGPDGQLVMPAQASDEGRGTGQYL